MGTISGGCADRGAYGPTREQETECKKRVRDATDEALKWRVNAETEFADRFHGLISSPHEGWAVIREETLEANAALDETKNLVLKLDAAVRQDAPAERQIAIVDAIYRAALDAASECVQTAATAARYAQAARARKSVEFARI